MKKTIFFITVLMILALMFVGCSKDDDTVDKPADQTVDLRTYIMEDSDEPVKPFVSLEENGRFSFTYSLLNSTINVGSYEVDGDSLILTTDGENDKYVFKIQDGMLIFNEEGSSEIPVNAHMPNGSVFK